MIKDDYVTPCLDLDGNGIKDIPHGKLTEEWSFFNGLKKQGLKVDTRIETVGFDANADGELSESEKKYFHTVLFGNDSNKDGHLEGDEIVGRLVRLHSPAVPNGAGNEAFEELADISNLATEAVANHEIAMVCFAGCHEYEFRDDDEPKDEQLESFKKYRDEAIADKSNTGGPMRVIRAQDTFIKTCELKRTAFYTVASPDANKFTLESTYEHPIVLGNKEHGQQVGVDEFSDPHVVIPIVDQQLDLNNDGQPDEGSPVLELASNVVGLPYSGNSSLPPRYTANSFAEQYLKKKTP